MARKRYRRYARRAYGRIRRYASKPTLPLGVIFGFMGAPQTGAIVGDITSGQYYAIPEHMGRYVGIANGQLNLEVLRQNMVPIIGGLIIHKVVGNMLGLNRMLAKAKVPWVRV